MLRYFSVYGPRQRTNMAFHRAIEAGLHREEFLLYEDGCRPLTSRSSRTRSRGRSLAGKDGRLGQAYNIGGGSRISMLDVLEIIGRELPDLVVRHATAQQGDARDTAADVSLAHEDFGYEPSWNVERGLIEQIRPRSV